MADYFERGDLLAGYLQAQPFLRYAPAIVAPVGERRPQWWMFAELARRMGLPAYGTARREAMLTGRDVGRRGDCRVDHGRRTPALGRGPRRPLRTARHVRSTPMARTRPPAPTPRPRACGVRGATSNDDRAERTALQASSRARERPDPTPNTTRCIARSDAAGPPSLRCSSIPWTPPPVACAPGMSP